MVCLILGEPTEQLMMWRERLSQVLAADARVLANSVPSIELIYPPGWLKEQPSPPSIESGDSHLRFCRLVSNVLAVFASTERPLSLVVGMSCSSFDPKSTLSSSS